jgi:hypothetical protein
MSKRTGDATEKSVGMVELSMDLSMLLSQQTAKESPRTGTYPDAESIRAQLNRLLAHPLFTNSKRYPVLLSYTVEQTLLGNAADLKERTIGVEAFGRDPEYDVNLDPVVRTSAAEVRRRLVQYYYDPAHAGELIIELSAGSYIPAFREPDAPQAGEPDTENEPDELAQPPVIEISSSSAPQMLHRIRRWFLIAIALLAALGAGIAIGRYRPPRPPSNVDRFWEPMASSQNPITYCVGEPSESMEMRNRLIDSSVDGGLSMSDVVTLARTIVPLVPRHSAFRVIPAKDASFAQLREGPIVLIGAFDNEWTMRITQDLRFGFDKSDGMMKVIDRKDPKRFWAVQWDVPYRTASTDYAIVARIYDNVTGQPVIIAAGILGEGTEAASEVLYNPTYLNAMLNKAPKNWAKKNLEAVIQTNVIDGNPGPPEILDVESW